MSICFYHPDELDHLADGHRLVGVELVVDVQLVEQLGKPEPQSVVAEMAKKKRAITKSGVFV
jgi:hypothetical protein